MSESHTPSLMYPKSGPVFLLGEVQRLTANVADMIDACVAKDQRIAALEAELAKLQPPENVVQLESAQA